MQATLRIYTGRKRKRMWLSQWKHPLMLDIFVGLRWAVIFGFENCANVCERTFNVDIHGNNAECGNNTWRVRYVEKDIGSSYGLNGLKFISLCYFKNIFIIFDSQWWSWTNAPCFIALFTIFQLIKLCTYFLLDLTYRDMVFNK